MTRREALSHLHRLSARPAFMYASRRRWEEGATGRGLGAKEAREGRASARKRGVGRSRRGVCGNAFLALMIIYFTLYILGARARTRLSSSSSSSSRIVVARQGRLLGARGVLLA